MYFRVWDHALEYDQPTWSHTLKERGFFFLQRPSTISSSSVRGGASWTTSFLKTEYWLAWSCTGLVLVAVSALLQQSCHVQGVAPLSSPTSGSYWAQQSCHVCFTLSSLASGSYTLSCSFPNRIPGSRWECGLDPACVWAIHCHFFPCPVS